jgi:hypothetical protein
MPSMGLRDVTGVLSRYFVLGYFVPGFFTLVVLANLLTPSLTPAAYEGLERQDQILVLGAAGLLLGLVLLGLRYPIIRILEGYPFELGALRRLRRPLIWLQRRSFDRLQGIRDNLASSNRASAARLLDRRFHSKRERLLPTRFGNALRATENYPYTRWGLDAVAVWPRIDALLTDREQELHTNAMSDLAFFVNGTIGALTAGVILLVDAFIATPLSARFWWLYLLPFLIAYALYRAALGAAERHGTERRASIDLHRLDLYERLGVRTPTSFSDEKKTIAPAVNKCLLYATAIPDDLVRTVRQQKGVT